MNYFTVFYSVRDRKHCVGMHAESPLAVVRWFRIEFPFRFVLIDEIIEKNLVSACQKNEFNLQSR